MQRLSSYTRILLTALLLLLVQEVPAYQRPHPEIPKGVHERTIHAVEGHSSYVPFRREHPERLKGHQEALRNEAAALNRQALSGVSSGGYTVLLSLPEKQSGKPSENRKEAENLEIATNIPAGEDPGGDIASLNDFFSREGSPVKAKEVQFVIDYRTRHTEALAELLGKSEKTFQVMLPDGRKVNGLISGSQIYYRNAGYFLETAPEVNAYYSQLENINKPALKAGSVVISFINNDSHTSKELAKLSGQVNVIRITASNYQQLDKILAENRDNNIYVIGHIENGSYVSKNSGNEKEFSIEINELNKFRKENSYSLITLGCNAITNNSEIGSNSKINSIKLIEALRGAVVSKNLDAVFNALSETNAGKGNFLIDHTFIEGHANFEGRMELEARTDADQEEPIITSVSAQLNPDPKESATSPETNDRDTSGVFTLFLVLGTFSLIIGFPYLKNLFKK